MKSPLKIIIVASGPRHRSSAQAGILYYCGAFGGEGILLTGPSNPKGFFENWDIKDLCVIPYIERFLPGRSRGNEKRKSIDPKRAPVPFEEPASFYDPPHFRERVLEILRRQGWDGEQPLFYKMPLATLMCSVWHHAFPEAKWIVLQRDTIEVRDSMIRQDWLAPVPEGEEQTHGIPYVQMYEKALAALRQQADVDWRPADMEKLLSGDYSEQKALMEWLGLEWNEQAVKRWMEQS